MKTHIFVVPGNPGITKYYEDFSNLLKDSGLKVDILSYETFTDPYESCSFSIENEVSNKKDQILKLIALNRGRNEYLAKLCY